MGLEKIFWLFRNYFSSSPFYVISFVTARCNAKCAMCFYWKNIEAAEKSKELSLEEFRRIAEQLPHIQQLSIGGGEPFLRDDLAEICGIYSKISHAQIITIPTNGTLTKKIRTAVEKMLQRCPGTFFRIFLSIDAIGEKHDKIRGVKGCFKKLMKTYKELDELRGKYSNLNIDAGTVLSSYNQNDIKETFEWVEKNLSVNNHQLLLARGDTRNRQAKNVRLEKYEEMIEWLCGKKAKKEKRPFSSAIRAVFLASIDEILRIARTGKGTVPCVAGSRMIVISETGDLYPCEILNRSFGNLREANFELRRLLKSENAKNILKYIKTGNCACTFECAVNASVAFSPRTYPGLLKRILSRKAI